MRTNRLTDQGIWMITNIQREKLDEVLFQVLRTLYRFGRVKIEQFGLSYEGIYLLQYLRRNPNAGMTSIAEEMRVPISTLTRIADRLEKKGFLSRKRDPQDMRKIRLLLETAGDEIVTKIEDHTYTMLEKNLEGFVKEDFNSFLDTAVAIGELFDTTSVPVPSKKQNGSLS